MFRARLSVTVLESRENPSGPELIGPIESPPSTEPLPPAPPSGDVILIGSAIAGGAQDAIAPDLAAIQLNTITNQPLIPIGIE